MISNRLQSDPILAAQYADVMYIADMVPQERRYHVALIWSAAKKYTAAATFILENKILDVNDQSFWRAKTALMFAAANGCDEIVDLLLSYNADTDLVDKTGWTALMKACKSGHTKVVKTLLDHGAVINKGVLNLEKEIKPEIVEILHQKILSLTQACKTPKQPVKRNFFALFQLNSYGYVATPISQLKPNKL